MSIFLRRILGYSYVVSTNFPINNFSNLLFASGDTTPTVAPTFPAGSKAGITNNGAAVEVSIPVNIRGVTSSDVGKILVLKSTQYPTRNSGLFLITALQQGNTTTIASGSNGVALPTGTINVASTSGFPASGTLYIGVSTTTTTPTATTIASGSSGVSLPTSTINVASTTGFTTSGTILVVTTAGTQVVTYTGITGNSFTGCSGGTGTMFITDPVQLASTIGVVSTAGFASSGTFNVQTYNGTQTVTYTGLTSTTFTGCTGLTSRTFTDGTLYGPNYIQTITYTGTNATQFTGCTGGSGSLVTGQFVYNQNKYVIDYRGNGEAAITQAADTVMWWLYEKDIRCPQNDTGNGLPGYNGVGSSKTPRIILQSPHALGWQVRICNESTADSPINIFNAACAPITAAPGFGGDSAGDYPIGGDCLHSNIFFDKSGAIVNGDYICGNGFGDDVGSFGPQHRFTFMGDDTGQSVHMISRRPGNLTVPRSIYVTFGLPDNEPLPLPAKDIRRLYVLASARGDVGNGQVNDVSLAVGYTNSVSMHGCAFHDTPISAHPSQLAYVYNTNQLTGPTFDSSAGDCPFTSSTELMPVDITAGTIYSWAGGTPAEILQIYPKSLGSIPIMRNGRANFGNYTLTTDNSSWNVSAATNASPIQITTSAANTLVTGQSVAIHSVGGNTAANGTWTVTVINSTNFTLDGSTGNGAYTSGGVVLRGAQWQHMRNGIYFPWNGPAVVP